MTQWFNISNLKTPQITIHIDEDYHSTYNILYDYVYYIGYRNNGDCILLLPLKFNYKGNAEATNIFYSRGEQKRGRDDLLVHKPNINIIGTNNTSPLCG